MVTIMNTLGGVTLVLAAEYLVFLSDSAFRLMNASAAAKTPTELLKAVVAARRHYGFHALASFVSGAALAGAIGILSLTVRYSNPGVLAWLAFGDGSGGAPLLRSAWSRVFWLG